MQKIKGLADTMDKSSSEAFAILDADCMSDDVNFACLVGEVSDGENCGVRTVESTSEAMEGVRRASLENEEGEGEELGGVDSTSGDGGTAAL